jgi:CheY-like chemotaxis protein
MAPPPVPDARAAPAPRRSSRCVLYVEDDEFNRLLLAQVFAARPPGQLLLAGTVAEGIDMAVQSRPDLILADMNLPDGHGIELIARVHDALPVIRPDGCLVGAIAPAGRGPARRIRALLDQAGRSVPLLAGSTTCLRRGWPRPPGTTSPPC